MSDIINGIKQKIWLRKYEFSRHALDQMLRRGISVLEIETALKSDSEIIEDYPEDKYGASCLILGMTTKNRPLHILCSYPSRPLVKIITVYEPGPDIWTDHKIRKSKENQHERNHD